MSIIDADFDIDNLQIRWMTRQDMPEVLIIENKSFEFTWSEEDFLKCLRQRNTIGMVIETNDYIVGYMIYELLKEELRVLNFAVSPQCRRKGVGHKLIQELINKIKQQRRNCITLETRETNIQAQLFFKSCGFVATNVLRGYYVDTDEDAYHMVYDLYSKELEYSEEVDSNGTCRRAV